MGTFITNRLLAMFPRIRPRLYLRYAQRSSVLNSPISFYVRFQSSGRTPSPKQGSEDKKISDVQKGIVEALKMSNVIVSARPGSGKTTTAGLVVKANPESKVLILTYSRRLKMRTEKELQGNENVDIHTFHS